MQSRPEDSSSKELTSKTSGQGMFSKSAKEPKPFFGVELTDGRYFVWDTFDEFMVDMADSDAEKYKHAKSVTEDEFNAQQSDDDLQPSSFADCSESSPRMGL